MALSLDDTRKVANLARLRLDAPQEAEMAAQLSRILDYVAELRQADTSGVDLHGDNGVPPCPTRPDEVRPPQWPGLSPQAALANAPDQVENMVKVPKVVGGG